MTISTMRREFLKQSMEWAARVYGAEQNLVPYKWEHLRDIGIGLRMHQTGRAHPHEPQLP